VTIGQWKRFVADTKHQTEAEKAGDKATWKEPGYPVTDAHPVACVSFHDTQAFCEWLSKKTGEQVGLPTEAQWEFACRANTTTRYSFGDDESKLGDFAWFTENTNAKGAQLCGTKKPNAFGLHDMHGNVYEWCADGKREYKNQAETAPVSAGVIRGGSFFGDARYSRAAHRYDYAPADRGFALGFRVAVR
jgi:formylglycine-generating enzyme required for sulfatase activity